MTRRLGPRLSVLLVAVLASAAVVGAVVVGVALLDGAGVAVRRGGARANNHDGEALADNHDARLPRPDATVTVGEAVLGRPIAPGFVGLSVEYPALGAYTGHNPAAVDPVLEQLIRNLAPGQSPVLRIGGDSTDTTWWPTAHERPPAGVSFGLTPRWLAVTRALARDLGARLILGVNLEADRPELAAAEARALLAGIGPRSVQAIEIGNEAPRYALFPWYHAAPGDPVFARPASYDYDEFAAEFSQVRRLLGPAPLAGPTMGGFGWKPQLRRFLRAEPRVRVATFHRYPLNRCFTPRRSPAYPTIPRLLSPAASHGIAAALAWYIETAHRQGDLFRVDEMNSVACGGQPGVSNTFASALWALDTLFSLARAGADGVNLHSFPGAAYSPFRIDRVNGQWRASVRPEYYGLLVFAQAAPPGSRLLRLISSAPGTVRAWATRAADGSTRVVLINAGVRGREVVLVRTAARAAALTLERLKAPSAYATGRVELGGRSFGAETRSGDLPPLKQVRSQTNSAGQYELTLPAASAALITIRRAGQG